jgi:CDP-6-deoxy-D-xylo-4-hexulose-3-dehydrase
MSDPVSKLRNQILAAVADFHDAAFAKPQFIPGETPVPVSGRVFGAEELQ